MEHLKEDIIHRLKNEILSLEGFRQSPGDQVDVGLAPLMDAFPNARFPIGAIHEFISSGPEDKASTYGFIAGILSHLMKNEGISIWISSTLTVFPPALKYFGIEPDKIIFINLHKEKDILWGIEECLKSNVVTAVVGELNHVDFTASRRYQLAVEQSHATGFIIRRKVTDLAANACIARWKITSLPSIILNNMPGVGFPRWNVELLKVRNGKPGTWQLGWKNDGFYAVHDTPLIPQILEKKTG